MTEFNQGASRLQEAFSRGKAFIPFITCGDPDLETTKACIREMAQAGTDVIELGVPFSDPTAEGPVIQEANVRALAGGIRPSDVFDMARDLRQEGIAVPFVIMTYANVPYAFGAERFMQRCAECGIDGLILPDLPFEEKEEFQPVCDAAGVALISLIAPTSQDRIALIASQAKGFIYLVSSLGVTGTRTEIGTDLDVIVHQIRQQTEVPVAIGFGISGPEQGRKMAQTADGVIVGSAIVKLVARHGIKAAGPVGAFVREMVEAVRPAGRTA
ncbi:tryptophan synthase subunit alpha [Faecalibaculum rodentium]|uniref:tryptophan synthase subunit alpha n=1 Tax=Faecalibaculum rodentium TaxID=1702221 RepID=UPI0023F13314|nr:tryptophan synthase subunit alpha [Faecalibaculum rodentium]